MEKLIQVNGSIRVESALKMVDGKILPAPLKNLFFFSGCDYRKGLNLDLILGSTILINLLNELDDGKTRLASLEVKDVKEVKKDKHNIVINLEIRSVIYKSPAPVPEIFAINFSDGRKPFPFTAQDQWAALRMFMGLFGHLSSPITHNVLKSHGVASLDMFFDEHGHYKVIFPSDNDQNFQLQQTLLDYNRFMIS